MNAAMVDDRRNFNDGIFGQPVDQPGVGDVDRFPQEVGIGQDCFNYLNGTLRMGVGVIG